MTRLTAPLLAFLLFWPAGCVRIQKRPVSAPPPADRTTSAPLMEISILDKKIESLTAILKQADVAEQEKAQAKDLLQTYQNLKTLTQRSSRTGAGQLTDSDYRRTVRTLFQSLSALDKRYFARTAELTQQAQAKDETQTHAQSVTLFAQKRKEIMDAYLSSDYRGVITRCLSLRTIFGPNAMTAEIGFVFALSLAKQKMTEEAVKAGEETVGLFKASGDLLLLRAKIAEWYLTLGKTNQAFAIYEMLTDKLDERGALLEGLSSRIIQAAKSSPAKGDAESEKPEVKQETDQKQLGLEAFLKEVDALLEKQRFNRARMLLVKRRISTEDTDEIAKIEEALKKVAAAKDASEKEKIAKGPSGDPELDSTRKLMEAGKYEEAIKKLDERKLATGGDSKSDALKSEAVTKLINQERNRAAKLFLAAKNTTNTSQKAKLLTDCLNILKALVEKYPTSPMIEKINSHIAKVEEELSTLQKDSP